MLNLGLGLKTEFFSLSCGLGLVSFGLGLVNNVARPADSWVIIGTIRQTIRQMNVWKSWIAETLFMAYSPSTTPLSDILHKSEFALCCHCLSVFYAHLPAQPQSNAYHRRVDCWFDHTVPKCQINYLNHLCSSNVTDIGLMTERAYEDLWMNLLI